MALWLAQTFSWRFAILASQDVVVDCAHDIEDFYDIAWIIRRVAVPDPASVRFGVDRPFKQGKPPAHLVEVYKPGLDLTVSV